MSYHGHACMKGKYSAPVSSVVKSRRLSLFEHVARMNELADTNQILFVQPPQRRI